MNNNQDKQHPETAGGEGSRGKRGGQQKIKPITCTLSLHSIIHIQFISDSPASAAADGYFFCKLNFNSGGKTKINCDRTTGIMIKLENPLNFLLLLLRLFKK